MTTVYEVQSQDITELNDLTLTKLLKMLLHLEARSAGIAEREVEVALNIRVADGGEDGRIEWDDGPNSTDYLPTKLVQFQNKATNLGPKDCADEIVGSDGNLKKMVEEVLDNDGSYILFTTQELNKRQKRARVTSIRKKLDEIGKTYADTAIIKIYDASTIQGWVNHYAAVITAVLNWVGRPLVNGLYTWDEWEKFDENHLFEYVSDEVRNDTVESLRKLLLQPGKSARIIGLSGLGKTRLALEVCRDQKENDGFSERVVYLDASYGEPNLPGLFNSWVQLGLDCLLVLDNCHLELHKQVRRIVEHPNSRMSLLSIHYNPEKDFDTEPIQLSKMSDSLIKAMLDPVYGDKIPDLDRIVAFAQGFPQMAVLLSKARLDQNREMGSLTDDDLIRKMLWGGNYPDELAKKILQACSLFDKFGIEEDMEIECKFIAEDIAGTDVDSLYRCIKSFENRGVINKGGRFAQVIPKPLAIRLAADWWRSTRLQRQLELVRKEMPGQLERSFCDQISKLDFLPQVKELTENLCGEQGPFGQAEVILSVRGSRLFRSLVEVNPQATSEVLYKNLDSLSHKEIQDISGDVRRNLVNALEKLCFHDSVFVKSAKCLMWLAAAENEEWANNATGQFLQLFRTFLSGTAAPPEKRLILIDEAIQHDKLEIQILAVKALESVIDTHGGTRMVGAEYQGSGKPLEEWRPKIWKEAFDYWISAIEKLTFIALENEGELCQNAKNAIGYHIRGLVHTNRDVMMALDGAIRRIIEAKGALWPAAIESIRNSLTYDSEKMPDEVKKILHTWIKLLTPEKLKDRIELFVSIPPFEHEQDKEGHFIDVSEINAEKLALEFIDNISQLSPYLEQLLVGEQRQGFTFGRKVVLGAGLWEPLLTESVKLIQKINSPNINFLLGILDAVYQIDHTEWENYIELFKGNKLLCKYYPDVIRTGLINEKHLNVVIDLIQSRHIDEINAYTFKYGRALKHLDPNIVIKFVNNLKEISFKSAWIGFDILFMYCYQDKDKLNSCMETFNNILIDLPLNKKNISKHSNLHSWSSIIKKIIKNGDVETIKKIVKQILNSIKYDIDYSDIRHNIKPILRLILTNFGEEVWPIFAEAIQLSNSIQEYRITQLLSSEDSFSKSQTSVISDLPEKVMKEWCQKDPKKAPVIIAESTETLVQSDEGYQISSTMQYLLDNFGNNKKVLSSLSGNMGSFGWSGSVVPIFKKELKAINPLLKHKHKEVREWAEKRISYLNKSIERESIFDEEASWGIR